MSTLYEDALKLSIDEELQNLGTLLGWAADTKDMAQKIAHSEQALTLLGEVCRNLRELQNAGGRI